MDIENYSKLMLSGSSVALGALLGVLRSKIFAIKHATKLYYFFYIFSAAVFLFSVIGLIAFWNELIAVKKYFDISIIIAALISSVGLFIITKKYLHIKDTFKTPELDPIVNGFTSNADKNEIKLFGGDLNFFGNSPADIDINKQYTHLRGLAFKKISILCEAPTSQIQRIRYGKILSEMPGTELKFYFPDNADLRVRGRIIQVTGVNKLLMYTKIKSGVYQAIETDTGNSNGALYNNIWELAWSLATKPSFQEIDSYISLFKGTN